MDIQYVPTSSGSTRHDVQIEPSLDDGHLLTVRVADPDGDVQAEVDIAVADRNEVEALRAGLNKALDDLAATFD